MNFNFFRGKKCSQTQNDPPLVERERAVNTKQNTLDTRNISQDRTISRQIHIGPDTRNSFGKTLAFWLCFVCILRIFPVRNFISLPGLGGKMNDKLLPHDLDAELGLLNACICIGGIERVIERVESCDFIL